MIFIILLFTLFITLEGSVTTIPLVLVLLLNCAIVTKKPWIFALAFFCGLFLDAQLLNPIGKTSLFYLIFLAIVFLYEKKFDTQTFPFVFIASYLGSFIYLFIYGSRFLLLESLISAILGMIFFWFLIRADKIISGKKSMTLSYEK